jgi:hypothetical protein
MVEDFLTILENLHGEIEDAMEGLPQTALDWVPGPDLNSLGVLVVHVAGAERYWLGDVVVGEASGRDRPAEFRTTGLATGDVLGRLADSLVYARTVAGRLTPEDLNAIRISPRDGRELRVAWCLQHVLGHTALHTGHIQITRQWWDQRGDVSSG